MPAINGTVDFLSIKELAKPDNYDNTHRASIKIGDSWYSYGTIKKDKINIKTGDSWTELAKGMEVEFMYDQNGDFKNIKKKTFSITDASGAVASAPQQSSVQGQGSQGGTKNSFVNPAMRGQCMNLAAEVLGYKEEDFSDSGKIVKAIKWYLTSAKDFEALWDTAEKEIVAGNTPIPSPKKSKPEVEDDYDDEEV